MIITLPGAAAADLASLDCSLEGKPDAAVGSTRQPLPSVTRQALPVWLREAATQNCIISMPLTLMRKEISMDRR